MDVKQISIEKVVFRPLVLRNINRVAKDSGKRVVGVLLGSSSHGIVDVTNSYTVPFEEDGRSWFLDQSHHQYMLNVYKGIKDMVGWYSTSPELQENDIDVHAQFCRYAPNPVMVIIDVQPKAYYAVEENIQKVFVSAPVEISAHEVKEFGLFAGLLSDTTTETATKTLTLGGGSLVDAMESFYKAFKNRVKISVEGYDMSLRPVDLDTSLVNHFSSCGFVEDVNVPRDPVTNTISSRFTTVVICGKGAEERALALNGSDVGGWRVSVKILPQGLDRLRSGLSCREAARQYAAHFRRHESRGITVKGYDRSLCDSDVKSVLVDHFSSCGDITDVFVLKRRALVYFFGYDAVRKALKHCRSQKSDTGFRARAMPTPKRKKFVQGPDVCR